MTRNTTDKSKRQREDIIFKIKDLWTDDFVKYLIKVQSVSAFAFDIKVDNCSSHVNLELSWSEEMKEK